MSHSNPKRPATAYPTTSSYTRDEPSQPSAKKPRFDARNPSTLAAAEDDPDTNELDDLILDADVIGKSGAQTKRRAVRIDGYDSDSEEEGFKVRDRERQQRQQQHDGDGVGKGRKQGKGKSQDEDEDDMFADLDEGGAAGAGGVGADGDEDEDLLREGKKRGKKDVRFLDLQEMEGQDMASRSGGHVSSELLLDNKGKGKAAAHDEQSDPDSSSEEDDEETRARPATENDTNLTDAELAAEIGAGGKKKHAPRLDAFNLKSEEEEGRFDEAGNYVRLATDPDANNDSWLEGLSRKDMRRAKAAQEARAYAQRAAAAKNDALLTEDLLSTLIGLLEAGETILEALQRLNRGKKGSGPGGKKDKPVPKWKLKKQQQRRDGMEIDEEWTNGNANGDAAATVDPAEAARRAKIEGITAAADALYSRGQLEIYDTEREMLMRQFRRETGEDWTPQTQGNNGAGASADGGDTEEAAAGAGVTGGEGGAVWQFRWSDARDGGDAHGPYDAATMKAWQEAGYFGEGVEFRRGQGGEWSRVLDVR